jgi:hypothetical protein
MVKRCGILVFGTLFTIGCAARRPARVVIPADAMSVKITDFTKPCRPQPNGTYICDGVVVHVSYMKVEH